ncbi:hypothetical protein ABE65_011585 [Fictibacillus phosphorivorans]|uniref:HNH domain-containing protein n=1 Tax=Fictibacillus phosphorivorans TaxID=1221500 RepID=A0A161IJ39_9BACL|nr:HNH endonuclease [Fictibacillus phosphorivorans]ANC77409.1 hypothetical protein ABE65_011585 [Fictibacillus phosphorivorans]
MIKIDRTIKPAELTDDLKTQLTNKYKTDGTSVWNHELLKVPLLHMSHKKCCYCECNIAEESKYMEVEHFYPKDIYPDLVVDWANLLPACKRCNTNKSNHDPNQSKIINPCQDNPRTHIGMKLYRLKGKDEIGSNTIDVIYLNEIERLVYPRFQIGTEVQESIEDILEKTKEYYEGKSVSTRRKNRIVNGLKKIMEEGRPQKEYSAVVASVILNDNNFNYCKDLLINLSLWDDELIQLESVLSNNSLDIL